MAANADFGLAGTWPKNIMLTRILMIEDDPEIADFVTRGLREEGYDVALAADAESGWRELQSAAWDLVLLDWSLPGTDGLTLLRALRAAGQTSSVLFLTARDAVADRVQGLDSGAEDYLCKPFAFAELLARIRSILRSRGGLKNELRYRDVRLDLINHKAQRAGKDFELTAKEEALLIYFLQNPDEVLSRSKIYEAVWDEAYDGLSNTLEVHVVELRRKIESYGPRLIHTVRGKGYVLGEKPVTARRS